MSPIWRQRLILLFIIACFAVPLAAAWLLVGRWQPNSSIQHGELLNPARPLANLRFTTLDTPALDQMSIRAHWVLVYLYPAAECNAPCQTVLYNMRQARLALGKDMGRVKTLLLLDAPPNPTLYQWLTAEHPAMMVGIADVVTRNELSSAFGSADTAGEWIYLLDPLGNLLMRYSTAVDPRGILKDLQRLLRLSNIG